MSVSIHAIFLTMFSDIKSPSNYVVHQCNPLPHQPSVLCRLLILVRPEMRGAVRDAIDQYGWDLKHQHVAVALEFEAQVSARTRS